MATKPMMVPKRGTRVSVDGLLGATYVEQDFGPRANPARLWVRLDLRHRNGAGDDGMRSVDPTRVTREGFWQRVSRTLTGANVSQAEREAREDEARYW